MRRFEIVGTVCGISYWNCLDIYIKGDVSVSIEVHVPEDHGLKYEDKVRITGIIEVRERFADFGSTYDEIYLSADTITHLEASDEV